MDKEWTRMQARLKQIVQYILNSSNSELNGNKPIIDQLVKILCDTTELDIHPEIFIDNKFSATARGKAVSMITAAQCAEEFMRTQVFLRGVHQALQEQLEHKEHIRVLYAGTGPFGLLLLPLLPLFSPEKISVTLLDIHQESLDALQKVQHLLNVNDHIERIDCVDILQWQPQPDQTFDIIISETMKAMLDHEPQVSIFAHLSPWLAKDGCLVPESIRIDAWLTQQNRATYFGNVFTLNHESALQLSRQTEPSIQQALTIPSYPIDASSNLKFTTDITVYRQHKLSENQCSLNLPYRIREANPKPNSTLNCFYEFGVHPKFKFEFERLASFTEQCLPSANNQDLLNLPYLNRIWHKHHQQRHNKLPPHIQQQEWALDIKVFDILKLGLERAIQSLYQSDNPDQWAHCILEHNQGQVTGQQSQQLQDCVASYFAKDTDKIETIPSPLTKEQLNFWQQNGYLVIPKAITDQECQALLADICQHMQISLTEPESWYQHTASQHQIMVQLFDSPAQEHIRQKQSIKDIFAQLWQTNDLTPSYDRVSFNPPETNAWRFPGPVMHWDIKAFEAPLPFATQGLIYLTDTAENQGAFCCVPGFHREFDAWAQQLPEGKDPQQQDWDNFNVTPIAAQAGDLIIWHHALPHGSSPNRAQHPRIVQYLNMTPSSRAEF